MLFWGEEDFFSSACHITPIARGCDLQTRHLYIYDYFLVPYNNAGVMIRSKNDYKNF